jgi:hypothetical protein
MHNPQYAQAKLLFGSIDDRSAIPDAPLAALSNSGTVGTGTCVRLIRTCYVNNSYS